MKENHMARLIFQTIRVIVISISFFVMPLSSPAASLAAPAPVHAWAKTWGGTNDTRSAGMAVDSSGNIYVTGEFVGTTNFDPAGPNPNATFTSYNGTVDAFLVKLDYGGNFRWARTWGAGSPDCVPKSKGCGRDSAGGVVVDQAGNVYVGGLFQNTVNFGNGHSATSNATNGTNNIFLTKFSTDGTNQWVRAWGGKAGGEAYSLAIDRAHGSIYIEGDWSTTPNTGWVDFNPGGSDGLRQNHGAYDTFLCKYALDGTFQWVRSWGGEGYDDGPGVAVDAVGNVFVSGMYGSTTINFDPNGGANGLGYPATHSGMLYVDVFLSKFDANGNFQWVRTWGGDADAAGTTNAGGMITIDSAGNVLTGGRFGCTACYFNGTGSAPGILNANVHANGSLDAFVIKYDGNGALLWTKTWGGAGWDATDGMTTNRANEVYVSTLFANTVDFGGGAVNSHNGWDSGLVKLSANGSYIWDKTWGGSGDDYPLGQGKDALGNVYLTGSFQNMVDFGAGDSSDPHTAHGTSDAFLSKFSPEPIYSVYLPFGNW
jgi:hypothetical protein